MAFWSAVGPEPKRNYRWVVTFSGPNISDIRFALKKVDKPKAKIGEVTHKYLNHSFYYPGRLEWEAINMVFASVSQPDATKIINNITRLAGYGVPEKSGGSTPDEVARNLSTIGKNKFSAAIGSSINITQVDADGFNIENWELHNPFFTSVQYGSLDYGSEEIVEITCTVRYDWAKLSLPADPTTETANSDNKNASVNSNPSLGSAVGLYGRPLTTGDKP